MVSIELPIKPSEAAALADVIFQFVEGRPLNDELRNRLNGRVTALELTSMAPYMGSLQKDPIHSSAYYIAVDAIGEAATTPLLLRMALASSPVSALFPDPLLIGRMRPGGGREIIVNAIPFASTDHQNIRTFADRIDRSFLPRPQGTQSSITVAIKRPDLEIPAAFDAFRAINRKYGVNLASIAAAEKASTEDVYCTGLWAAIRAGWRDGWNLALALPGDLKAAQPIVMAAQSYTRFTIPVTGPDFENQPLEQIFDFIQDTKSEQVLAKYFDVELSLEAPTPTTPDEISACLGWLKTRNRTAQLIAPNLGDADRLQARIAELAAAARQFNATLSFHLPATSPETAAQQIGRATGGRFDVKTTVASIQGPNARRDIAEHLVSLASDLRT
jgi:hypothetical protein